MAKAKKKVNPLLAILKRSFSGWAKAGKYVNSGKWADDFSKAVHRSGAGKRAQQRAKAAPQRSAAVEEFDRSIAKAKAAANLQAYHEARSAIEEKYGKSTKWKEDIKATNSAKIYAAIRNAKKKAAKTFTTRSAHNRTGTSGVAEHKVNLSPKKRQAVIAKELSSTDQDHAVRMQVSRRTWQTKEPRKKT